MFQQGIWIRDGQLTHVLEQPGRGQIMEAVAATRAEPVADREGLGRWALSVPFEDWLMLRRRYPALASKDTQTRSRAWLRFMASPEGAPYRMRERV